MTRGAAMMGRGNRFWAGLTVLAVCAAFTAAGEDRPRPRGSGFIYSHDEIPDKPWSIHILKVDRTRLGADLEFHTTSAGGSTLGLSTLTDQLKTLPRSLGQAVCAVNGDFWKDGRQPAGDPLGLHIREGELISSPAGRVCLWFDLFGQPHLTNVQAQFTVTWPGGQTTPIGLNEERSNRCAVLYTPAVGASTLARGGRELVLEHAGEGACLPLRAGQTYKARVREIREAGDTKLTPDTLVLSLSPEVAATVPPVAAGAIVQFSTAMTPDLRGVKAALGGGPALVREGQALTFGAQPRHPRTAIGWNDKHLFLVVVDGRQHRISVGMTPPELADYMVKLGCRDALNLDGGSSSTFWVHGQVMNSPSAGRERAMANALVLVQKPRTPAETPRPNTAGP